MTNDEIMTNYSNSKTVILSPEGAKNLIKDPSAFGLRMTFDHWNLKFISSFGFRHSDLTKAFTLVEMMVATTILAVGIVLVLRSLLSAVSVLDYIQNRITAICFLEGKMNVPEQTAVEEGGVEAASNEEETLIGNRKAIYRMEIGPLEMEEEEKLEEGQPVINIADLRISWQEGSSAKEAELATYFLEKEE